MIRVVRYSFGLGGQGGQAGPCGVSFQVVRIFQVVQVVKMVRQEHMHSENIWFTWSKLSVEMSRL